MKKQKKSSGVIGKGFGMLLGAVAGIATYKACKSIDNQKKEKDDEFDGYVEIGGEEEDD